MIRWRTTIRREMEDRELVRQLGAGVVAFGGRREGGRRAINSKSWDLASYVLADVSWISGSFLPPLSHPPHSLSFLLSPALITLLSNQYHLQCHYIIEYYYNLIRYN